MKNILLSSFIFSMLFFSCSAEKSFYNKAEKTNTIQAYEEYLSKYKQGKYAQSAKQKITEINFAHKRDSAFTSFIYMSKSAPTKSDTRIIISPSNKILMGTPHSIGIRNLPPDTLLTLHAYRRIWNHVIYSYATYKSDANGSIQLCKTKPLKGTYLNTDSLGIYWSMTRPFQKNLELPFKIADLKNNTIYINIEFNKNIIANEKLELLSKLPGIISNKINNDTLTAVMHYPANKKELPVLILLSGSEGGYDNTSKMAKIIASHGYAVVALAYFKIDPLPEHLENIQLEYFFNSLDWIKRRINFIDSTKLVIAGGSRGGELALLLASLRPDIKGVVAVEPSCVLWQGLPHSPWSVFFPEPAWTLNGEALPFLKHRLHLPTLIKFGDGSIQINLMKLYEGILDDNVEIQPAFINVEDINGPIMLVAGENGKVWPSYRMCKMIEKRLQEKNFNNPVESYYYKNAGHYVMITPDLSPTINYKYEQILVGGTDSGNACAQIASWNKMISFLKKYF